MLPKSCGAAREGETKLLLPAGCLGRSTTEKTTVLTPLPLSLQRCRDLCLPALASRFLSFPPCPRGICLATPGFSFLAPSSQAHWVLPHGDGELCLCFTHFFGGNPTCSALTSYSLCSSAQRNSSLKSRLLWRRTGTAWAVLFPAGPQHSKGKFRGLCPNLPTGMSSTEGHISETVRLYNFITPARQAEGFLVHRMCSCPYHAAILPQIPAFLWNHLLRVRKE